MLRDVWSFHETLGCHRQMGNNLVVDVQRRGWFIAVSVKPVCLQHGSAVGRSQSVITEKRAVYCTHKDGGRFAVNGAGGWSVSHLPTSLLPTKKLCSTLVSTNVRHLLPHE